MLVRLDPASSVGLAEQIASQVRSQIAAGDLAAGDRLPPARQLAQGLDVNLHTVLRAYAALRDEGLVEMRRGRGAHVAAGADTFPAQHRAEIGGQINELVTVARRLGLTQEQLFDEIKKVF